MKRIGEESARKWSVCFGFADVVVDILNVDTGDVVGKKNNFVCKNFADILAGKIFLGNEAALDKASDEGTGAGEGIEDGDTGIGKFWPNSAWRTSSTEWIMKSTTSIGV